MSSFPSPLLRRASARYLRQHPWQFGLSILGVALGVAVAVAVNLATGSARRAFELSSAAVTGATTHQVVAGSGGVPEDLYRRLRSEMGLRTAAPVVEGYVGVQGHPGLTLRLLGVDPFAERDVRPYFAGTGGAARRDQSENASGFELASLIAVPGTVVASASTAADLDLVPGGELELVVAGRIRTVELIGRLRSVSRLQEAGLRDVLLADISTAQEILSMEGRLTRIDLVLPGQASEAIVAELQARLPDGVMLVSAAARTDSTIQMTRAFRLNLTAMSLLAMLCGMFLIYNTMTFSVVQRRGLIGALRALGVTRGEIFWTVLLEAAWVGTLGTLAGVAGGVLLGSGLVRLVTRTINDLYFVVAVRDLALAPTSLAAGVVLGMGGTLLAALAPALEATRTTPRAAMMRSALEGRHRRLVPRLAASGTAVVVVGAAGLAAPEAGLGITFAALFLLLLGFTLLSPAATVGLSWLLGWPLRAALGVIGKIAARGVTAHLSRTTVAVAALMIAVSVIIGVGVMVASFRTTLERWLEHTLAADLYVSPVSVRGDVGDLALDEELRRRLLENPGIDRIQTLRRVQVETTAGPVRLLAVEIEAGAESAYRLQSGGATAWPQFRAGAVLVSEPFAHRWRVVPGSVIDLPTDSGWRSFAVAGVYYSYASDQGAVLLSRQTYEQHWQDRGTSGVSIYTRPGADRDEVAAHVRRLFAPRQQVVVIANAELREQSLRVFDRTFLITSVLRMLVMVVAFVGVLSALMAMQLERVRELGILRAQGLTPGQLWGVVTAQTGLLGLISGLLALPVGLVLAWVMIHVINKRSFGWSLQMDVPPEILWQSVVVAVIAALLAGLYPCARMARTPPAGALRQE